MGGVMMTNSIFKMMGSAISTKIAEVKTDLQSSIDNLVKTDNNFTTAEKNKLSGVDIGANNYVLPVASETVLGGVRVDGIKTKIVNGYLTTDTNWVDVVGTPITLSGYGITDAAPSSHIGSTGTAHGVATTTVAGFMSSTDKTKLDNTYTKNEVDTITGNIATALTAINGV